MTMRRRVLVIDDEPDDIDMVRRYLDPDQYEVISSTNPFEGIQLAKQFTPDAIILDLLMDDMDGYEVCKRLGNNEATKQIPVIVYSVDGSNSDAIVRSVDCGALVVVSKESLGPLAAYLDRLTKPPPTKTATRHLSCAGHELKLEGNADRVWLDGIEVVLKPIEQAIVSFLADSHGTFRTRDEIGEAVWGDAWQWMSENNVYRWMYTLRKTIDRLVTDDRSLIESRKSVGYRLVDEEGWAEE